MLKVIFYKSRKFDTIVKEEEYLKVKKIQRILIKNG